jgi:hypothetical protein
MASASSYSDSAGSAPRRTVAQPLQRLVSQSIECLGFWAAVVLPFALLALLASGAAAQHPVLTLGCLLGNLVGLGLGRNYRR